MSICKPFARYFAEMSSQNYYLMKSFFESWNRLFPQRSVKFQFEWQFCRTNVGDYQNDSEHTSVSQPTFDFRNGNILFSSSNTVYKCQILSPCICYAYSDLCCPPWQNQNSFGTQTFVSRTNRYHIEAISLYTNHFRIRYYHHHLFYLWLLNPLQNYFRSTQY